MMVQGTNTVRREETDTKTDIRCEYSSFSRDIHILIVLPMTETASYK